ncbi:MAG: hypothetical protein WC812_00810 [Candidatus Pacearchaeota archaeon]|jgi:hypothetical protein
MVRIKDIHYEEDFQRRYLEYAHMNSEDKERHDPTGAIGISLADEAMRLYGSIENFPEWIRIPNSLTNKSGLEKNLI